MTMKWRSQVPTRSTDECDVEKSTKFAPSLFAQTSLHTFFSSFHRLHLPLLWFWIVCEEPLNIRLKAILSLTRKIIRDTSLEDAFVEILRAKIIINRKWNTRVRLFIVPPLSQKKGMSVCLLKRLEMQWNLMWWLLARAKICFRSIRTNVHLRLIHSWCTHTQLI